jgi:2-succinyl-6-hydroxy-2,4-cyclohexadiene-1-carboxylate synthase
MWMLLHGFTGSPRSWDALIEACEIERDPLRPALLGHGPDWRNAVAASFDEEVARLASMALSLDSPRFICGYSMGARVALGMLISHPGVFDAAVLISVHPGLADEQARSERREVDAGRARLLRAEGTAAFVAAWEDQPLFESQRGVPRDALNTQREVRLGHDAEGLARALEVLGLAEMPDYRDALAMTDVHVVLMAGERDSKFSALALELSRGQHRIEPEIVARAGHNVVLEAPGAVASALHRTERHAREGALT